MNNDWLMFMGSMYVEYTGPVPWILHGFSLRNQNLANLWNRPLYPNSPLNLVSFWGCASQELSEMGPSTPGGFQSEGAADEWVS